MACKFLKCGQNMQCLVTDQAGIPSLMEQAVFCYGEYTGCPFYVRFQSASIMKKRMQQALELKREPIKYSEIASPKSA